MSKLTTKQEMFVAEYLVDLNATQAAIRSGYSKKTAYSIGNENLSKPEIQEAIAQANAERFDRLEVTSDMVIEELARIAFLDVRKAFDEHGNIIPIHDMPEDVARAVAGMDISSYTEKGEDGGTETTKKIKLIDKKGALELLGKTMAMFSDKQVHTGANGGPIDMKWTVEVVNPENNT